MCEVRPQRIWKPGPLTPRMRDLLSRMQRTDSPIVWDFTRGIGQDSYTLDGEPVNGATLNGLDIRGLVVGGNAAPLTWQFRLTDEGGAARITGRAATDA